jgi:hypothetical protein
MRVIPFAMSAPPAPFDVRRKRAQRARSAPGFAGGAAFLHQRAGDELAARISAVNRTFARALVFGAGGGILQPPAEPGRNVLWSADSGCAPWRRMACRV